MGLTIGTLSRDSLKVVARLLNTDKKHVKYINSICNLEDPEFVDYLFIKTGSISLDWGDILDIDMYTYKKKEVWKVVTTKGWFEFQIMNKPEWIEVDDYKLNNENELKCRRTIKSLISDGIFNLLGKTNSINLLPWKL